MFHFYFKDPLRDRRNLEWIISPRWPNVQSDQQQLRQTIVQKDLCRVWGWSEYRLSSHRRRQSRPWIRGHHRQSDLFHLAAKSLTPVSNWSDNRLQVSCQWVDNHSDSGSDCKDENWYCEAILLEDVFQSLSKWRANLKLSSLILKSANLLLIFSHMLSRSLPLVAESWFSSSAIFSSTWMDFYSSSISMSFWVINSSRSEPREFLIMELWIQPLLVCTPYFNIKVVCLLVLAEHLHQQQSCFSMTH